MDASSIFKALANPYRLKMLEYLIDRDEIACQELMKHFSLSQPTLSHHFNKLVEAKIVINRKEGVLWFYRLNQPYLKEIGIDLKKIIQKGGV